jgi:hypothetical protein
VAMPWRPDVVRLLRLRAAAAGLSAAAVRGNRAGTARHHGEAS